MGSCQGGGGWRGRSPRRLTARPRSARLPARPDDNPARQSAPLGALERGMGPVVRVVLADHAKVLATSTPRERGAARSCSRCWLRLGANRASRRSAERARCRRTPAAQAGLRPPAVDGTTRSSSSPAAPWPHVLTAVPKCNSSRPERRGEPDETTVVIHGDVRTDGGVSDLLRQRSRIVRRGNGYRSCGNTPAMPITAPASCSSISSGRSSRTISRTITRQAFHRRRRLSPRSPAQRRRSARRKSGSAIRPVGLSHCRVATSRAAECTIPGNDVQLLR